MTPQASDRSDSVAIERATDESVPVVITDPQPVLTGFVEDVRQNLDGIHDGIAPNADTDHVRLDPPRRPRISNAQAQVISTAMFDVGPENSALTVWQQDTLILWARELVKAEMLRSRSFAVKPRKS